jgi:hypothetical protein
LGADIDEKKLVESTNIDRSLLGEAIGDQDMEYDGESAKQVTL